jgi:site-specific DNA-methyltransferase (adenine-specific)
VIKIELNKIYNEDCIHGMQKLSEGSVDLIVTDPPYLISYKTNYRKNKKHDFCSEILNDDNEQLIKDYIKECYRVLKDNTALYMFCSSKTIDFFKQEIENCGFKIKNIIVWVKNNWTAGDLQGQFGQQYEFIILANKGRCKFNGARLTDVWNFSRVAGKSQLHQNQKPVDLIKQCIEKHSNEGDVVLDGFMGSGTTAIASIESKRNYIGWELDTTYCDMANKRIQDIDNKTA